MIDAAYLRHRFVFLVSMTNSGKTYDAIQAPMKADSGCYLDPLRLLALEVFDKHNEHGCWCSLVTVEEQELTNGAQHIASTIELCIFHRRYDVAVIDVAQLLADHPFRGAHWTRAILGVDGALPPQSRREEGRKFARGESKVVVATDAIGMGVSLIMLFPRAA